MGQPKRAGTKKEPAKAKKSSRGKKSKDQVIQVLNKARSAELTAITQYMAHHYALDDADYGQVAANIKLIAIDEMRHAEMFAERIYEMGGVPTTDPDMESKKGQKIDQAIAYDIGLENTAIDDYNEFLEVCLRERDSISAKLFDQIIAEEQEHLNYFENVKGHIDELGQAYLAQIAGGQAESGPEARGFIAAQGGGA